MFIDELRKNREQKSLKTIGMSSDELSDYYKKSSNNVLRMIEEKRISNIEMIAEKTIKYKHT
ncbi:MAG: hypothetical protein LBC71_00030 [Oscillospiraceae bacterium]|jgi:hypothetical protein|nr:hypothetical protein [Oscillospiraceae bacterium]